VSRVLHPTRHTYSRPSHLIFTGHHLHSYWHWQYKTKWRRYSKNTR